MKTTADRLAVLISLGAVLAAVAVGLLVFEHIPHLEDEFAYQWQARVIARGDLTLPTPEFKSSFLVPFVVDYQGQRFGKYPLGWPALLSLGSRLGGENLVNPLLAGLAVWLTYRLGKKTLGERAGLLGAALLATSPAFLIQSGTLLSHLWSLVLVCGFLISWLDLADPDSDLPAGLAPAAAGGTLGLLGLTRPLTALLVGLPALAHGLWILLRGESSLRWRVLFSGLIALLISCLHLVWQGALTGSPLTNPYTLWWPYDRLGFGPGIGVTPSGHNLIQGWRNTRYSLRVSASDLFGWGTISYLLLPFGIWAGRKSRLIPYGVLVPLLLVGGYLFYWVGSWLLGPRYYIEAWPLLALITAAGISYLAGWSISAEKPERITYPGRRKWRAALVLVGTALLVFANLAFYLPARLGGLKGLYGIEAADQEIFQAEWWQEGSPSLVIVHSERWMPYGSLLPLQSPHLDSQLIFAWSIGPITDQRLADYYQEDRQVFHYYPDQEPWTLTTYPND